MMSNYNVNHNENHGGIGFVGLLTILFIALKLTNFIDWSWWWVLSPIWISFLLIILIVLIIGTVETFVNRR
jgi:hypothetical protein